MSRPLRSLGAAAAALTLLLAAPAAAQERVPYQMASVLVGWTRLAPTDDGGLEDVGADAGGTIALGLALERLQRPSLYVFGRLDGDAADIRQHLSATAGLRYELPRSASLRPYLGAGGGLLWIQPQSTLDDLLDREFALRAEAFAGLDWEPLPELRWFLEYRLAGASYHAVGTEPGCSAPIEEACLTLSETDILHIGHTVWGGLRIRMF